MYIVCKLSFSLSVSLFQVKNYQRLKPLVPLNYSLNGLFQNIRPGDCVVAFSRKRIFSIKQSIERETGQSCAVVYGGLPPGEDYMLVL